MSLSRLPSRLVLSAALLTCVPEVALAETSAERAAARAAAESGADAFEQGRYERALEMFIRAEKLVHAPPHLLFMARSLEKLGRLVEAREAYLKILNEQLAPNAPPAFRSARASAEQELAVIEPRLAQVTVNVTGPDASSAAINLDGTDLPPAVAAIPMPADPGRHVFYAHTERAKSAEVSITLGEGDKESITLVLSEVPGGAADEATRNQAANGDPTNVRDAGASDADAGGKTQRIVAYSFLGLGAVGAGAGTFLLVSALDKRKQADDAFACDRTPQGCSSAEQRRIDGLDADADQEQMFSIVSYAVGGAALVTGVVLLLTADSSTDTASAMSLGGVRVTPGWGSLELSGRF